MILKRFLAACVAALLLAAPAAAQEISTPSGVVFPLSGSCGTVTTSQPCLDLTATWGTTGTYVGAIRLNVTDSGPANAASNLLDLQVASSSVFAVRKSGSVVMGTNITMGTTGTIQNSANGNLITLGAADITITNGNSGRVIDLNNSGGGHVNVVSGDFSFSTTTGNTSPDLRLLRDAAGTLAQRNGTNAQTFCAFNTYTDSSNYERGCLDWISAAGILTIGAQKAGTGSARQVKFVGSSYQFATDTGGNLVQISAGGNLIWNTDNTSDIGASGATRPRNLFVGTSINAAVDIVAGGVQKTVCSTVSGLPSAATKGAGSRSCVTDATACTVFMAVPTGGGSTFCPVVSDGAAWKEGKLDLPSRMFLPARIGVGDRQTLPARIGEHGTIPVNDNLIPDGLLRAFG